MEFQFHKGTIKAINSNILLCSLLEFQFHKGTIKEGSIAAATASLLVNFNSIKVQLKRGGVGHFGRLLRYFNSIKVQLKHYGRHAA